MTCGHPHAHYAVDGARVCYSCWQSARRARRATLRAELARLLAGGVTLLEKWPSGMQIEWTLGIGGQWQTFHHQSGNRHRMSTAGAAPLADHLESRVDAFGTTLTAYCLTCGEELVGIDTAPDAQADPRCEGCELDALVHAAEVAADGR